MKIEIENNVFLTTDHSASSYGIPVVLIDGKAFGARDMCPDTNAGESWKSAYIYVQNIVQWWMRWATPSAEELELAQAFNKSGEAG